MKTFDQAARGAVIEAIRRAGNVTKLSAQINISVVYLTAYKTGIAVIPEEDLRSIRDYLKREN